MSKKERDGEKLRDLRAVHQNLLSERKSWESDWLNLSKHFLPRKMRLIESEDKTNEGGLRSDVPDSTAILAMRVLAAGMHGGMTSPARPWFRLTVADHEKSQWGPIRAWLDDTEERMRSLFARCNFYQAIHMAYLELGTFGTQFMFQNYHPRSGFYFQPLTVGEYCIDVNQLGQIDTVFRVMDMTAKNIIAEYGEEVCSEAVKRAAETAATMGTRFKVVHAILPRLERDAWKSDQVNMPFASFHYELGRDRKAEGETFLRESGFNSFPGMGARWDVTGQDAYGRSPGMDCLPDARQLMAMRLTYLKQEHKRSDPPIVAPPGLEHPDLLPGGINPLNAAMSGGNAAAVYPVYQVTPDASGMKEIMADLRQMIREGLYNDLFKMLAMSAPKPGVTATEIAERHEEKLMQLGPVVERLHGELYAPLIDRSFQIMLDNDMIAPWPEELDGVPIKVDFVSLLAQAQKMVSTKSVDQFMGFIGAYSQLTPELADVLNPDEIGEGYAEYLGIPQRFLRTDEEREQVRMQRAQQMQQAQAQEAGGQMIEMISKLGNTPSKTPDGEDSTALDTLTKGMGKV